MFKRSITIIALLLFLFPLPLQADSKTDGKIVSWKSLGKKNGINIVKIKYSSDELKVSGLMFLPGTKEKLPCVIFCHDGITGISKQHRLSSIRLAKEGYAVFSPSYRGEDDSEGEIEVAKGEVNDVLHAVAMVKGIKQVDGDRIALVGASHGALISVLAASRCDGIKAVVEVYGVMDIYKWWDYLKKNNLVGRDNITKQTYGDGPDDQPESFVLRNAVTYVKHIKCPVLILQGQKDKVVPPEQAKFLKEALDKNNVPNEMKIYPNCLHGFLVYVPYLKKDVEKEEKEETAEAWNVMLDFLKRNLADDKS
jgi:dipeptidyl aminopeptidase/acylaminoacyl peptidase